MKMKIDYAELEKFLVRRYLNSGAFDRQYAVDHDAFGLATPVQISTEDMNKMIDLQKQLILGRNKNKITESIRHEPVDNMPQPPSPHDYVGGVSSPDYRKDYDDWKAGLNREVTVDLTPLTPSSRFRCATCRACDLNEKDLALNPRDGQIYGCWHCGGKKLEKI